MSARHSFHSTRRAGLTLALASLILAITAPWLAMPAAAQFMIGRGMGMGIGMGIDMMPPPAQPQNAPPPPSSPRPDHKYRAEHKSSKAKNAESASVADEKHAKDAPAKSPAKSDSNSSGAF
jgi:hypothetical protein